MFVFPGNLENIVFTVARVESMSWGLDSIQLEFLIW